MENWGLITFGRVGVFFNQLDFTTSTGYDVAEVAAHEISHQWFGNLGKLL